MSNQERVYPISTANHSVPFLLLAPILLQTTHGLPHCHLTCPGTASVSSIAHTIESMVCPLQHHTRIHICFKSPVGLEHQILKISEEKIVLKLRIMKKSHLYPQLCSHISPKTWKGYVLQKSVLKMGSSKLLCDPFWMDLVYVAHNLRWCLLIDFN